MGVREPSGAKSPYFRLQLSSFKDMGAKTVNWPFWKLLLMRLGLQGALEYRTGGHINRFWGGRESWNGKAVYALHAKALPFPVLSRENTSDLSVFGFIFVHGEYDCVNRLNDVRFIVDCGANVGYATALFLNRFPQAFVVAVEPDPQNFALLKRNLEPYAERTRLYQNGIWSHSVGLVIEPQASEWGTQVREAQPEEPPHILGLDIETLRKEAGAETIDLLKVDIEYSEKVVFGQNYESWLARTKNIVIELHDDECRSVFFQSLEAYRYTCETSGEYTFCQIYGPK